MLFRHICLKHQLRISVLLRHVVLGESEGIPSIVPGTVQHQGQRGVVVGIDGKAILPLCLVTVGLYQSGVERFRHACAVLRALSACPLIPQQSHRQLADPYRRDVCPTVHHIVLPNLRHIHEAISIAVMIHLPILEMEQRTG